MRLKSNKWLDGKQQYMWPIEQQIGWSVVTAGLVDLDLEEHTPMYNAGRTRILPPEFPMILKDVRGGFAFGYNHNEGVIRIPVELLKPWRK